MNTKTRFFIEDSEGRWLADPEQPGEGWTRDPMKAWGFKKERDSGFVLTCIEEAGILLWLYLYNEGCGNFALTEHYFFDENTVRHPIPASRMGTMPGSGSHYVTMRINGVDMTPGFP